jgi:opacity protein-like surface antigen
MSGATLQFRAGLRRRPHKFLLCSIAICSALAARSVDGAWAADWPGAAPVLRGTVSPGYVRWDGWQAGIQAGFGNMNADFGKSTSSMVAFILRNSTLESEGHPSSWTTLPKNTTTGPVFGGFVGYNWQWSELVVGWDLAYKRPASLNSSTSDSLRRLFDTSDSVRHDVTIDAQASFKLVDYATLRGRAGYAFGEFLPYAFLGAAVGRFNYQTNLSVTDTMTNLAVSPPCQETLGRFNSQPLPGKRTSTSAVSQPVLASTGRLRPACSCGPSGSTPCLVRLTVRDPIPIPVSSASARASSISL